MYLRQKKPCIALGARIWGSERDAEPGREEARHGGAPPLRHPSSRAVDPAPSDYDLTSGVATR